MKNIIGLAISSSIIGAMSLFMIWINVPFLGDVRGIGTGPGMTMFFLFAVNIVLYTISLTDEKRNFSIATLIISVLTFCSVMYYYISIQSILNSMEQISQTSMFGMSLDGIYDEVNFEFKIGYTVSLISTLISMVFSFLSISKKG